MIAKQRSDVNVEFSEDLTLMADTTNNDNEEELIGLSRFLINMETARLALVTILRPVDAAFLCVHPDIQGCQDEGVCEMPLRAPLRMGERNFKIDTVAWCVVGLS